MSKKQVESFPGALDRTDVYPTTATGKGKTCKWVFEGEGRYGPTSLLVGGVAPKTPLTKGLTSIYGTQQKGAYSTFQPINSINGYPAVIYEIKGGNDEGTCNLAVGLSNDTAYRITAELDPDHPTYAEPCREAKKLAEIAVQTLKEAQ